jgi:hypothetical protein
MPAGDIVAGEAPVDAFVRAAHARLETQHLLAHDGEPEVARLDDARVDRAYRYFVDPVTLDAHELIIILDDFALRALVEIAAQRELRWTPCGVPQPWAGVAFASRDEAEQVPYRALHANRREKRLADTRIGSGLCFHGQLEHNQATGDGVCHVDREALPAVAIVRAPQRDEAPAALPRDARGASPLRAIHACETDRRRSGDRVEVESG